MMDQNYKEKNLFTPLFDTLYCIFTLQWKGPGMGFIYCNEPALYVVNSGIDPGS